MEAERRAWRLLRYEEMRALKNEESPDSIPTLSVLRCPLCGAAYRAGRRKWEAAPDDAIEEPCPACKRIRNDQPRGQVLLKGQFSEARCNDLLQLLKRTEEHEKAEHPLERTMGITPMDGSLLVATTGRHLARCIGEALYASYSGQVEYHYRECGRHGSSGLVTLIHGHHDLPHPAGNAAPPFKLPRWWMMQKSTAGQTQPTHCFGPTIAKDSGERSEGSWVFL